MNKLRKLRSGRHLSNQLTSWDAEINVYFGDNSQTPEVLIFSNKLAYTEAKNLKISSNNSEA